MNSRTLVSVFFGLLVIVVSSSTFSGTLSTDYTNVTVSATKTVFDSVNYANVTVLEAKTMIDSNSFLVVLDVRNQSEYLASHVRNAKLIPLFELQERLNELNVSDQILVYCEAGGRSATASQTLVDNGFLHVFNMLGGMTDWMREEYPVYVRYASIQEAISNATDGETVYISAGFYTEHLSVNRSVALVGEDKHTTIVDGTANGTVFHVNADNVSISDFTIQNSGCACSGYCGVNVEGYHRNINVTNNIFVADGYGIQLYGAREVTIAYNNITSTSNSCTIRNSSKVFVLENNIADNFNGLEIDNSSESTFSGNVVFDSVTGISVSDSNNNTFFDNYLSSNIFYGFHISRSNDNSMFHNNFLGNGLQVSTSNSTNFWDNGFEGNCWSDYAGSDVNLDGLGDVPHVIDSENRDNFPLMGMFQSFNTSLNWKVDVVSNSTINSFEYLETNRAIKLQVSSTAAGQTYGFCRIRIPHILIDPSNGSILVVIDNGQTPVLFLNSALYDNGTHRWIYFTYAHSIREILIVPEYRMSLVLSLFMTVAVMVTVAYWRKRIPTK